VEYAFAADTVLISDGGLATELAARGHDLSDALWSARLLVDAPHEIAAVHAAFFRAGARIATTASYQASFDGFSARGLSRDETVRLLRRSVELAVHARDEAGAGHVGDRNRGEAARSGSPTQQHVGDRNRGEAARSGSPTQGRWVAASVGPYGAALADGSEYRGRYGLTVRQLQSWHEPRLQVLAEAGADLLALETIPDIDEAEALLPLVHRLGVPAWLSYTIEDGRTRAGQPLSEAFALSAEIPEIVAVGVNCCAPDEVLPAIAVAAQAGKPVIVYPNSGERWDDAHRDWRGASRFSAALAEQWVAAGARIVGGCCRVRPADIAEVAAALSPNV
jgi:homocysteine S-methyltransferase